MSRAIKEILEEGSKNIRAFPGERRPPDPPEQEADAKPALYRYVRIVLRYKWSIVFFALVGTVIGGFMAASAVPIYRAQATLAIGPDLSNAVPGQNLNLYYAASYRFWDTQHEMLRSRAVAERVVDKLGLVHRKNVNQPQQPKEPPLQMIKKAVQWEKLATWLGLEKFVPEPTNDTEVAMQILTPEQEAKRRQGLAGVIRGGVSVSGADRSQITRVGFDSPDPEFAAEVVNTVVDAYIELGLESRLDRTKRTTTWITERLEDLRKRVEVSERNLQEYQQREGVVDLENLESLTDTKLSVLTQNVLAAETEFAELSKRYGTKHPRIITARAELQNARRALDEASRSIVTARSKQFELGKLERELESNRQLYDAFLEKFKESDLSSQYNLSNAQVVDAAKVPGGPYKPDRRRMLMQWGFAGLFFGVLLAFVREQWKNNFRTSEDVERKLAIPVVGVIPILDNKKGRRRSKDKYNIPERHFLTENQSGFAETVNHIRTGVTYSNVDDPPQTILVTSSVQGEGKTTIASNLAISYAQLGRTLLVDADLRKPRIENITSTSSEGGLVEYVAGTNTLQECIAQDYECENLYILKSGVVPPNPLELLSSKKLAQTLKELKTKFSHIVIDSAPVLPVSDAIVLGHIVDAVLLAVRADHTSYNMVRDALRRLRGSQINPLGVVLSMVQIRKSAYYYDGRYHSYYGGYYGDSGKSKAY